jgi:DeoR/GlpR family transcriptional regulator of sugar metabolism
MNSSSEQKAFQEERLREIMRKLGLEKRLMINDLTKEFNTTSVTIRKDLDVLQRQGLLKRTHGGAILYRPLYHGLGLTEKEKLNADEKQRIANEAVKLISEGDVIILDSGSTTTQLARNMKKFKNVTVITNAFNIALELESTDMEIILTGGSLQKKSSTLFGPLAENMLKNISADKLFLGGDGIDYEIGLTTPDINEANTSRVMKQQAGENILLVDSSKFGRRSLGVICRIEEIDKIITTKIMDKDEIQKLNDMGVEVVVV